MRQKGTLNDWNDDRGFGFIDPAKGGDRVFAHIKAFKHRGQRPSGGEQVTYRLDRDPRGRPRAIGIVMSGKKGRGSSRSHGKRPTAALVAVAVFLGVLALVALSGRLPMIVLAAYGGASLLSFAAYGRDKLAAKKNRWRTPESTLHLIDLLCGWPGGLLAQKVIRHKSSKGSFQIKFWITVVLNVAALGWLLLNPESASAWWQQIQAGM